MQNLKIPSLSPCQFNVPDTDLDPSDDACNNQITGTGAFTADQE
jgi:hypothetical protein